MGKAIEHLSSSELSEIAKTLFTVTKITENNINGLCPFHDDSTSSFSYSPVKDVFQCYACGAKGDLIKIYAHVKCMDQKSGYMAFMDAYVIKEPKEVFDGNNMEHALSKFPPLPPSWIEKLSETRGWTNETIAELDLRLQTHYRHKKTAKLIPLKKPQKIAIPVRDHEGVLKNIKLYQPGASEFKIMPWMSNLGSSLFPSILSINKTEPIWICEGESDCICARSMGLNAITQTNGAQSWSKEFTKQLHGCDIIIAYDDDQPGFEGAESLAEKLVKSVKSLRIIRWPDFMHDYKKSLPEKHGQDLTDFFMKHKKSVSDLEDLLAEAKVCEVQEIHETTRRFFSGKSFKPARLAKEIMKNISVVSETETGLLYRWNGQFWETYSEKYLRQQALSLLGDEARTSFASDAVTQIQDMSSLKYGLEMDYHEEMICLENGMFNLDTYKLHPHGKEYYSSYRLGVVFDESALCERWELFLKETIQDEDTIKVVQEFFGYCLTRDVRHEKSLHLIGPGSDGKSTLLSILQAIVGSKNCAAISMESLEKEFHRATLYKKLLNTCAEVEGKAFSSGWFKTIVSGDMITAAFKNKDVFEFKPFVKLAFAYNRFPKVLDNTDGLFRRILLVPFKKQFRGKEKDIDLVNKLLDELSGIFLWSLEGLKRLREQGEFTRSEGIKKTIGSYKQVNNPVLGFLQEECITENQDDSVNPLQVPLTDLYKAYTRYCSRYGFYALNVNHFGREVRSVEKSITDFRKRVNGKRILHYSGIALAEEL